MASTQASCRVIQDSPVWSHWQHRFLPESAESRAAVEPDGFNTGELQRNPGLACAVPLATSFPAGVGGIPRGRGARWPQHRRAV